MSLILREIIDAHTSYKSITDVHRHINSKIQITFYKGSILDITDLYYLLFILNNLSDEGKALLFYWNHMHFSQNSYFR